MNHRHTFHIKGSVEQVSFGPKRMTWARCGCGVFALVGEGKVVGWTRRGKRKTMLMRLHASGVVERLRKLRLSF